MNRNQTFTPAVIDQIVAYTNVKKRNVDKKLLANDLENTALRFEDITAYNKGPTYIGLSEQLAKIGKSADRLLDTLGFPDNSKNNDMRPWIRGELVAARINSQIKENEQEELKSKDFIDSAENVDDAIRMICQIRDWALHASEKKSLGKGKFGTQATLAHLNSKSLSAKAWLVTQRLPNLFEKHFGKKFGSSHNAVGEPAGPGARFIDSCLAKMGIKFKPVAFVKMIGRYSGPGKIDNNDKKK